MSPMLAVDGFEGPLDWLLELARARKVDLTRLSILALVEAFTAARRLRRPSWRDWSWPETAPSRWIRTHPGSRSRFAAMTLH